LQGRGIADQRKAIIEGLRESVEQFQASISEASAADVMRLVLMTQYFDTLKDIGANTRTNTVFVPHQPGGMSEIYQQLIAASLLTPQNQHPSKDDLDKIPTPSNAAPHPTNT